MPFGSGETNFEGERFMSMIRQVQRLALIMAALGIVAFAWAAPARADMVLEIVDVDAATTTTIHDLGTGDASFTGALTNYTISGVSTSANYDGNTNGNINVGEANILNVLLNVRQITGGTHTLQISVTTDAASSWTIPNGDPLQLKSTLAVSRLDGTNGSGTGSFAAFSSTLISGVDTTTAVAPTIFSTLASTEGIKSAPNSSPPFNLNNLLTVQTTGLNQLINLSATTSAINPVPEPSTFGLALSGGLIALAIRWGQKRREGSA
jgi:hypothetical protein